MQDEGIHGFVVASLLEKNGVGPIEYKPSTMEEENDWEPLDEISVLLG